MRIGDRIGLYFDFGQSLVKLYYNGELAVTISEPLSGDLFPHILFANMKVTATITSSKLCFPK